MPSAAENFPRFARDGSLRYAPLQCACGADYPDPCYRTGATRSARTLTGLRPGLAALGNPGLPSVGQRCLRRGLSRCSLRSRGGLDKCVLEDSHSGFPSHSLRSWIARCARYSGDRIPRDPPTPLTRHFMRDSNASPTRRRITFIRGSNWHGYCMWEPSSGDAVEGVVGSLSPQTPLEAVFPAIWPLWTV